MDFSDFEPRVLELMFKSDARMIPQLVAYRVGCSVEVARRHLDEMVRQSILTMEVDDKGVIYYDMGALVMFLLNVFLLPVTAGAALLMTVPMGAIWAGSAATEHNRKLVTVGYR